MRHLNIFILTTFVFSACGQSKNNQQTSHPVWQDNYYRYRNTNVPNISPEKFYRLNSSDNDTLIPKLLNYPKTEIINVNSSSVKYIPNEIIKLQNLKALNITWTDFVQFPRILFSLTNLVSLDIAFRDTTIIVDTLCHNFKKFQKLEMLSLISCGLKDLPQPLTEMKRLKYLNLAINKIIKVTTPISELDSLIEIDFSQNQLTDFPDGFNKLANLEVINFSDNNVSKFPSSIFNLKEIREVNLMNNPNFKLTIENAKEIQQKWKKLRTIYLVGTNHTGKEIDELIKILPSKLIFFAVED